jgi:hypothetical protein
MWITMWITCVKPSNPVNNFAIFAGYQSIFDVGDMGLCGLLGYPKNNGLVLGVISYTRYYERLS